MARPRTGHAAFNATRRAEEVDLVSGFVRYVPPTVQLPGMNAGPQPDFGWSTGRPPSEPRLTIKDIARALWRRKLLIGLLSLFLMAPAAYIIMNLPVSFTAQAMLVLRTAGPTTDELRSQSVQVQPSAENTMNVLRSEVQILNSQTLAERVIRHEGLSQQTLEEPPSMLHQAVVTLRSWMRLPAPKPVVQSTEVRTEEVIKAYRSHLSVFNDGKSFVILVSYVANTPEIAKRLLEQHLNFYFADQVQEKESALDSVHNWLDTELVRLAAKVQDSDQRLLEFRGRHNLLRSGGETLASHEMNGLVNQLGTARSDLLQKQARLGDIRKADNGSADSTVLLSPLIRKQREDEAAYAAKVAELSSKYSPDHPSLRAAQASLTAARVSLASETARMMRAATHDVDVAQAFVSVLERQVASLSQDASASEMSDLSQAQLQREADADRQLYDDLLRRSKQIEIRRQVQQQPDARLASGPSVSFLPTAPHRTVLLAASSVVMVMLSACFTLFLDRRRFQSRSLLSIEAICQLPGLSSVPQTSGLRGRRSFLQLPDSVSVFALSLQTLRNSLSIYSSGIQPKVVTFTSALPGEGKTTLAAYYAQSLAVPGYKVLLIDCDLRQSGLRKSLALHGRRGLKDLMMNESLSLTQCVEPVEQGLFDILALTEPVRNPQTVLSSPKFSRVIDKARASYDFVVIDTPPVAAVDDALPVAKLSDATVLVIRWCSTPHDVVRGVARRLNLAGARVTGVVLNGVDMSEYKAVSHDLDAYRPVRAYLRYGH